MAYTCSTVTLFSYAPVLVKVFEVHSILLINKCVWSWYIVEIYGVNAENERGVLVFVSMMQCMPVNLSVTLLASNPLHNILFIHFLVSRNYFTSLQPSWQAKYRDWYLKCSSRHYHGMNARACWWLTHWGRDKMTYIFQTFSNAFSWMKMY